MIDLNACANGCTCPYLITNPAGNILARFYDEQERDESLLTGDYPDDSEPAYMNEWD